MEVNQMVAPFLIPVYVSGFYIYYEKIVHKVH